MITVRYSCRGCGLENVPCDVPEREQGSDVCAWAETILGQALADDHIRRSPDCMSRACDVMIPITGAQYLGGPAVQ